METQPERLKKRTGPPLWLNCLSVVFGSMCGARLGWYIGFNIIPWMFPKDTDWGHAIGVGFLFIVLGNGGAIIGAVLGAAACYILFSILNNRRVSKTNENNK